MQAVSEEMLVRIERASMRRALDAHEKKAAELRSALGLVLRETFKTVEVKEVEPDGITRMRTDQIDRLRGAGKIDDHMWEAAVKFRRVFEAMSRGMFPGASSGEGSGTKARGTFRHPLDRMTERELFIYFKEYKPWAESVGCKTAIDARVTMDDGFRFDVFKKSFGQICYNVIVDNFGPSQLENQWPIPRGKSLVTKAVREALHAWKHLEFEPGSDVLDVREKMIAVARTQLAETMPPRRTA